MGHVYLNNQSGGVSIADLGRDKAIGNATTGTSTAELTFSARTVPLIICSAAQGPTGASYSVTMTISVQRESGTWETIKTGTSELSGVNNTLADILAADSNDIGDEPIIGVRTSISGPGLPKRTALMYFYE